MSESASPRSPFALNFGIWLSVLAICLTALLATSTQIIPAATLEPVKQTFGATDQELNALYTFIVAVITACAAFPIGWLADRTSRKLVLGVCVLLWSASIALAGFAPTFAVFSFGIMGAALSDAALIPILYSIIPATFSREDRVLVNGILVAVLAFGAPGLLLAVGGGLTAFEMQSEPWRLVFVTAAAVGVPVAALVLRLHLGAHQLCVPEKPKSDAPAFWRYVWRNCASLGLLYAALGFFSMAWQFSWTWAPALLTRSFDVSPAASSSLLGGWSTVGTLVGVFAGLFWQRRLIRALGRSASLRLLMWSSIASACAFALFAASASVAACVAAFALISATTFFGLAVMPTVFQDSAPQQFASRLIGLSMIVVLVPRAIVTPVFSWLTLEFAEDGSANRLIMAIVVIPSAIFAAATFVALERWFQQLSDQWTAS